MATFAPCSAKRTAIAWPMPDVPPVTRTFLPSRPRMPSARGTGWVEVLMAPPSCGTVRSLRRGRNAPPPGVTQGAVSGLQPGDVLPDLELTDHTGGVRRLSDVVAGDPALVHFYRGFWCPKEQAFFRRLVRLQDELEVAYVRVVSVSVDP